MIMFASILDLRTFTVLCACILPVLGDFMIYLGSQPELSPGGNTANEQAWVMSGEPACDGGFPTNSGPALLNPFDDVSFLKSGFNCEGCGGGAAIGNYDIERFELYDEDNPEDWDMYGSTTGHVGFLTLYQEPDKKSYKLVSTKKIGGQFTFWGTCYRAPSDSDDFFCTAVIVSTGGKHIFTCITPLQLAGLGPVPNPPSPPSTPPVVPPASRVKIMVAGDSISHGMENDWTWRWRLFAWIETQGASQFVGPYSGTAGPSSPIIARPRPPPFVGEQQLALPDGSIGLYAPGVAGAFLPSGHASWWGRQAAQTKDTIQEWVRTYQPKFLLLLLGFNDLGWGVSDADGLLITMKQLVDEARKAKPDLNILIGNVVHRTFLREDLITNTDKYNTDLRNTIPSWSTGQSPISYVDVSGHYDCNRNSCPDGYDGLHPNSRGEYHIAQAFAKVLKANHGFPGADFVVPANPEPRTLAALESVTAFAVPEGIYIGWARLGNARAYEYRSRIQGQPNWQSEGAVYPNTNSIYATAVEKGQTWEYQIRATGDNGDRSPWSGVVGATANPQTAPAPIYIIAKPRPDGIQVTWLAVTGYDINRYAVALWDLTSGGYPNIFGARDAIFIMDGLPVGHRFLVQVSTWINLSAGPAGGPSGSTEVVIGGSFQPAPPNKLEVFEYSNALDVQLGWTASPGAEGYHIYRRPITQDNNAEFTLVASTTFMTTVKVEGLFPGVWHYQFCVSSYYANFESDHSTACVKPKMVLGWGPWPPKNLAVYEYDPLSIQLGWHASDGAEVYNVYKRPITQNNDAQFVKVTTIFFTTWKIESLFPGVWHYEFCIGAVAAGQESDILGSCIKPPVYPGWAPLPPTDLAVYEYDPLSIQFAWHSSNGAELYTIYKRPITQDNNAAFTKVVSIFFTFFKIESLFPGVWHYEFCVTATAGGQESAVSSACIKPPVYPGWAPMPPVHLEVFEYDATTIQLGWHSSNGAEGYYVYSRSLRDNKGFSKIATIPLYTTIGIGFLFPGVWTFEFCIAAYAGGVESDFHSTCIIPPVFPGWEKKRALSADADGNSTSAMPPFSGQVLIYPNDLYTLDLAYNVTFAPGNFTINLGNQTKLELFSSPDQTNVTASTQVNVTSSDSTTVSTTLLKATTLQSSTLQSTTTILAQSASAEAGQV